jgi:signal transduction histidine kinase
LPTTARACWRPAHWTPCAKWPISLTVALQDARLLKELHARGEQLADLTHRLLEVQESERRSIAHELHDEAGQGLTALLAGLGLLERQTASSPAALAQIETLKTLTAGMMEELHRLAVHLRPVALDYLGLSAALQQLAESYAGDELAVDFVAHGLDEHERFTSGLEIAVYRLVQEALTNIVRHAQASRAGVLLERRHDTLIVIVEDNGVGFDPTTAAKPDRMGLFGLRERVELLGGRLEIESTPGAGATVIADIPLTPPQPAL